MLANLLTKQLLANCFSTKIFAGACCLNFFCADMSLPRLQQPAPEFAGTAVVNGEFKSISLSDYKGKYVVLFFYPLDFTFVCPTEIIAFSDRASEFQSIGCELIACSTDSHFSHLAWFVCLYFIAIWSSVRRLYYDQLNVLVCSLTRVILIPSVLKSFLGRPVFTWTNLFFKF